MTKLNVKYYNWYAFFMGMSFYAPIAIVYYSEISRSYTLGASILTIVMLTSALGEVPTGIWSDKIGRRGTMIVGSSLLLLGTLCYAISQNYMWLVIGAILVGLSRSFFSGNNDAFLHESLQDNNEADNYHDYLGKAMSMEHIGIAIGAVGGSLIAIFSVRLTVALTLIPLLASFFFALLLKEPKSKHISNANVFAHLKDSFSLFVKNKKLRLLSLTDAVSFATGEVSYQFRATYFAQLWPLWTINLLNTFIQLGASTSYYYSGKLINKIGAERLLFIRSLVGKISGLVAFGFSTIISPMVTVIPAFLYGAGQVAKNTLMQREFTAHQRATMSSLNSLLSNLTYALASLLIGIIADITSPRIALLGITIVSLPVVFIYLRIFTNHKNSLA